MIRSIELITGMKPLGLWDANAVPMYDAFAAGADNADPYTAIPSNISLTERNPSTGAGARAASRLPRGWTGASQADMDRLLWKSVHGWASPPPPPGRGGGRGARAALGLT